MAFTMYYRFRTKNTITGGWGGTFGSPSSIGTDYNHIATYFIQPNCVLWLNGAGYIISGPVEVPVSVFVDYGDSTSDTAPLGPPVYGAYNFDFQTKVYTEGFYTISVTVTGNLGTTVTYTARIAVLNDLSDCYIDLGLPETHEATGIVSDPFNKQMMSSIDSLNFGELLHLNNRYFKGQKTFPSQFAPYGVWQEPNVYWEYFSPYNEGDLIYRAWDLVSFGPPSWYDPNYLTSPGSDIYIESYTYKANAILGFRDLVASLEGVELDVYDLGGAYPIAGEAYVKNCYFDVTSYILFLSWLNSTIPFKIQGCTFVARNIGDNPYIDFYETNSAKDGGYEISDCCFIDFGFFEIYCSRTNLDTFIFENCYFSSNCELIFDQRQYPTDGSITKLYNKQSITRVSVSGDGQYQIGSSNLSATTNNIKKSIDSGLTWQEISVPGYCATAKVSGTGQYQTVIYNSNVIYKSSDYGLNFTPSASPDAVSILGMSSDGQYQSIINSYANLVYVSSDYGATWNSKVCNAFSEMWYDLAISDNGQYQTLVGRYRIQVSSDYGATWNNKLLLALSKNFNKIAMSLNGQYQTAILDSSIYVSNDYGETWVEQLVVASNILFTALSMTGDGQNQYAVAYISDSDILYSYVYKSSDYGLTWTPEALPFLLYEHIEDMSVSSTGQYQTLVGDQIHNSDDYGVTWTRTLFNPNPGVELNNCHFNWDFQNTPPSALTATVAQKDTYSSELFNIPIETDPVILQRWVDEDYNTGLFGEQRLGAGAFYFVEPTTTTTPAPVPINSSIVADFSVSIKEGYSPLTVEFTSNCIGNPTYFKWHFGDGSSVEGVENPEHIYTKPGIYSPVLEIRKDDDFDVIIKTNYIIINRFLTSSDNVIIESYENDSSKDWKFYIDSNLFLIFSRGGEIYKSGSPIIKDKVWTLVEFHAGTNQLYVSTLEEGRKKIPTYNISIGVTGMHIDNKLLVTPNSSMKIDELKAVKRDENLYDYFRSLKKSIYYLP